MISVVTLTTESLPPIHGVRWGGMYIAGFLTEAARADYVAAKGWRVG